MRESIKHTFGRLPTELMVAAIVAIIGYLARLVFKQMKDFLPGPWSYVAPVLVAFFILIIWNQVAISLDRNRQEKLRNPTVDLVEAGVRNVLYKDKFTITNTSDPNATFSIGAQDAQSRKFSVLQPRSDPGFVMIASKVFLTDEDRRRLEPILAPPTSPLLYEIRLELIKFGVGFDGVEYPLREITVQDLIPYGDAINEVSFLNHVMFVRRSIFLLQQIIAKALMTR